MGGGFSVNDKRVFPALDVATALVVGTRLTLFLSVVSVCVVLLRAALHQRPLAVVLFLGVPLVCTVYCFGRLLEQLWIRSGSVSVKLWSKSKSSQEYVDAKRQAEIERSAFELGVMTSVQREAVEASAQELTHG
jgi:hypothetical protein